MFAAVAILAASSRHSQMKRAMDTTWLSGWPSNHFVTAKSPCGAVRMRASTNGQQRRNFRLILRQSCPLPPGIRGLDYPSDNNIGMTYDVQWFTLTSDRTAQDNLFGDQKFWRTKF